MSIPREPLVEQAGREGGPAGRAPIDALLAQNLPALRAYVRLQMGRDVRAKESSCDLVQSVCREVLVGLDRFEIRDEGSFRHWLFEKAWRKVLDRQRFWTRLRRDVGLEAAGAGADGKLLECYASLSTPSQLLEQREQIERIEQAFDRLPEHYRQVITLARIVRLSHAEIARVMERSEDSVRNLLPRALARLGTLLQGEV